MIPDDEREPAVRRRPRRRVEVVALMQHRDVASGGVDAHQIVHRLAVAVAFAHGQQRGAVPSEVRKARRGVAAND